MADLAELARQFGAKPAEPEDDLLKFARQLGAKPDPQAELERLRASRGRQPIQQPNVDQNLDPNFPAGHAALIGAGRTLSKVEEGDKQLLLNALIAGKQALGMDTAPQFAGLNQQADTERFRDEAYKPLRQAHPLATGVGEAGPAAVAPVGQATTFGRVIAPALGFGAAGATEYGSPQERAIKGVGQFATGLAGGATGELIGRVAQPVRQAMNTPAQDAAQAAAKKISAPLLPSQIAGSQSLSRLEDMLARYPGSAGVMRDFFEKQRAAVNAKAGEAIDETGPLTSAVLGGAKKDMGAEYDRMRGQISGMPAITPVFDKIDSSIKMLTRGSTNGKEGALGMLNELKDRLYNTKQLTPDEYQGWVSDLSAAARETQNQTIKAALRQVEKEMDRVARGPLAQEWGALDAKYANLKTLMKPGVVNDATGDVNQGRLAGVMERQGGEALKTGKMSGPLVDLYNYARAVPQQRAGSPTAERQASDSVLQWMMAGPRYAAAKGMTSGLGRDWLTKGMLSSPEASRRAALLAQSGILPLSIGGANLGLLGFLSQ